MEERVPGTGDVWGFYESRRLVPLIFVPPQEAMPFLWGGRQEGTWPALLQYCVGAMISQHAVAWDGQLEDTHQVRAGQEGRLPTADRVIIRPPDASILHSRWYSTAKTGPENTDAALSPPRLE